MPPSSTAGDPSAFARPVKDPGDAWVEGPTGERFWGRFGAAGLVAYDPHQGVLLQHRAQWSHFGGTWGIPGGALQQGEEPIAAALREANEEAGVPAHAVRLRGTRVVDREVWRYTTLVSEVTEPFDPVVGDAESVELAWIPVADVAQLPLHPAFGQAWPVLTELLALPPVVIVVDVANVVGSVPNGWWKDRVSATQRLIAALEVLCTAGIPAHKLGMDASTWYASIDVVVEGIARGVTAPTEPSSTPQDDLVAKQLSVLSAPDVGDDVIAAHTALRASEGARVIVVTSDRELRARVAASGAECRGARWLLDMMSHSGQ